PEVTLVGFTYQPDQVIAAAPWRTGLRPTPKTPAGLGVAAQPPSVAPSLAPPTVSLEPSAGAAPRTTPAVPAVTPDGGFRPAADAVKHAGGPLSPGVMPSPGGVIPAVDNGRLLPSVTPAGLDLPVPAAPQPPSTAPGASGVPLPP